MKRLWRQKPTAGSSIRMEFFYSARNPDFDDTKLSDMCVRTF